MIQNCNVTIIWRIPTLLDLQRTKSGGFSNRNDLDYWIWQRGNRAYHSTLERPSTSAKCNASVLSWRYRSSRVTSDVLTPLGQFDSQFLIDFAQRHDDDEVDEGGRHAGHRACLSTQKATGASKYWNRNQNPVHYHCYDEYDDQAYLKQVTIYTVTPDISLSHCTCIDLCIECVHLALEC